ncbi:MAG: 4-(cytidine 5'-diphospho)-2-C-methyl-D-erythritol kinase [Bacteroidota bacterium]|nr:4-(cytidine 5'-diphospho)-2-C-methyl-D-erythritol kinase [Bacteroidota bacterium]
MVTFPNCKINLGLNILQKREDGYHDIETVFYPIPVKDILEIISSENKTDFYNTGIETGDHENNLCLKAFHLLKKAFPELPEIKMHLHKVIPTGAGLGGGSADASFTLLMLNKKYNLNIPEQKLFEYALQLGSDCPFFLLNKPCFASGRGEQLEPIHLSLSEYKILIVNPGIHINTKETFAEITPAVTSKKIKQIILQPLSTWKNELVNDFEMIVFAKHPEIKKIKEEMYTRGAVYSAMSGTGSSVFGIFDKNVDFNYSPKKDNFHKWIFL